MLTVTAVYFGSRKKQRN